MITAKEAKVMMEQSYAPKLKELFSMIDDNIKDAASNGYAEISMEFVYKLYGIDIANEKIIEKQIMAHYNYLGYDVECWNMLIDCKRNLCVTISWIK